MYKSYLEAGDNAFANKQYQEALKHYRTCLKKTKNVTALYSIGYTYGKLQQYPEAITYFSTFLRNIPNHEQASISLAKAYFLNKNYFTAIKHCDIVLKTKKNTKATQIKNAALRCLANNRGQENIAKIINQISQKNILDIQGSCNGFAILQIAHWLSSESHQQNHPRIEEILAKGIQNKNDQQMIEKAKILAELIDFGQNPEKRNPDLNQSDAAEIIEDMKILNIKTNEEHFCELPFDIKLICNILRSPKIPKKRAIYFGLPTHTIAIFKKDDQFYMYEPSSINKITTYQAKNLQNLFSTIKKRHCKNYNFNDCVPIDMGFITNEKITNTYQQEIDNKITTHLQNKIRNTATTNVCKYKKITESTEKYSMKM